MWQCVKCREKLEDTFEVCWNCGTAKDGTEDPGFRKADEVSPAELEAVADPATALNEHAGKGLSVEKNPIFCPRCDRKLDYAGTKKFIGVTPGSFLLSEVRELFGNREHLDVYVCPRCGRVELFIDGVGEEFRSH